MAAIPGTHDRDAVHGYLAAVYKVVRKWKSEQRGWEIRRHGFEA
jgi:hypothetical protein